jgi:hypothetical protein
LKPLFKQVEKGLTSPCFVLFWSEFVTFEGRPRERKPLPLWFWDWLPAGVIGAFLLLYFIPFQVLGLFDSPEEAPPQAMADIVVAFGPRKIYAEGSGSRVKAIEVKVVNRGEVTAQDIEMFGEVRGSRFPLRGPPSLEVGASGTYLGDVTVSLSAEDKVRIVPLCVTCPPEQVEGQANVPQGQ